MEREWLFEEEHRMFRETFADMLTWIEAARRLAYGGVFETT